MDIYRNKGGKYSAALLESPDQDDTKLTRHDQRDNIASGKNAFFSLLKPSGIDSKGETFVGCTLKCVFPFKYLK